MRETIIVAALTALVTAIVAIWGTTVITAHSPKQAGVAPTSSSVGVMQMMKDAKGLPEEKFDAH